MMTSTKGTSEQPKRRLLQGLWQTLCFYGFGAAMIAAAYLVYAAVAASSQSLPIALGGITAAIGLVANISFNFNRTVEDVEQARELNRRSGKLLLMVINLVYAVMLSVVSLGIPGDPQGAWRDLLGLLKHWMFPLMVGGLVLASGLGTLFQLLFFERYITTRSDDQFDFSSCSSKFERQFVRFVEFTSRAH